MPRRNASELTPPAEQVARFRAHVEALTGETPSPGRKLGLAVSGGPDSMAMLLLAAAAYPGAAAAATVDHRLRAEAAGEAAFVAGICARLDVPHAVLTPVDWMAVEHGNLQERARTMRYMLLQHWGGFGTDRGAWRVQWIAAAHQRDDVAEGFLMRARRGAGLRGLAAMPATRELFGGVLGPSLVRPLLRWGRAELAAIVERAGLVPACDPSNADPRFDRSRVRALLRATPELPPGRLALAARNLRDAEDALEWVVEREWQARAGIEAYETVWLDTSGLPHELRRRLVREAIAYLHSEIDARSAWRGTGIDRLIATLDAGKGATLAGIMAKPGARWRFTPAPPRRSH